MQRLFPLVLLALTGCGPSTKPALPPTIGDFVTNNDGIGAARVFGIDFSVRVDSGGASTDVLIDANLLDPVQSSARKRFTLGDDITIQLDSIDESNVKFTFKEQDFGTLNIGDKVVIDEERNVEVNGNARLPKSVD